MQLENIIAGRCTSALLVLFFITGCTKQFVIMDEVPSDALRSGSKIALVYALPCSNMDTLIAKFFNGSTPLNEGVGEWKIPPDFEDLMSIPPKVLRAAIDDAAQEALAR